MRFKKKEQMKRRYLRLRPTTRHSLVLFVAGAVYFAIGFSYFKIDVTPERARALVVALEWFSLRTYGVTFMLCGFLICVSAKWPSASDKWGYTILTGLSA